MSSKKQISGSVGWCYSEIIESAALEKPEKISLPKDKSPNKRGFLSCPAVRDSLSGVVVVRSSFSLHLKFKKISNSYVVTPIYPFTSIGEGRIKDFVRLEPKESWLNANLPAFQFPTPYLFLADEDMEIEQFSPSLLEVSNMNWRVIPGRFNIYGWQRPLNWAIEWDIRCGDLIIKQGDPLYFARFFNSKGQHINNIKLINIELTPEIKEKLDSTTGVTSLRRGLKKVMDRATEERDSSLMIPKKK